MLAERERRFAAARGRVLGEGAAYGPMKRRAKKEGKFDPLAGPRVVGKLVNADGTERRAGYELKPSGCPFAHPFEFRTREGEAFRSNKSCGRCWYCCNLETDQRVGLAMEEIAQSAWQVSACSTYAGPDKCPARGVDHAEERLLIEHFQAFEKALREMYARQLRAMGLRPRDYPMRIIKCGEKGGKFGRSHFHWVAWGNGPPLEFHFRSEEWMFDPNNPQAVNDTVELEARPYVTKSGKPAFGYKRAHIAQWPHGFVQLDLSPIGPRKLRYLFKYLSKGKAWRAKSYRGQSLPKGGDEPVDREAWVSLPKRPHLGLDAVVSMAERDAAQRLLRRDFVYLPGSCADAVATERSKGKRYTLPKWGQRTYLLAFLHFCGLTFGDIEAARASGAVSRGDSDKDRLARHIARQLDDYGHRAMSRAERWIAERERRSPADLAGDRRATRAHRREVAEWRLDSVKRSAERWQELPEWRSRPARAARLRETHSGDPEVFAELDAIDAATKRREIDRRLVAGVRAPFSDAGAELAPVPASARRLDASRDYSREELMGWRNSSDWAGVFRALMAPQLVRDRRAMVIAAPGMSLQEAAECIGLRLPDLSAAHSGPS